MRLTLTVLIALLIPSFGQANSAKLAPELQGLAPDATVDVIIQFKQTPTALQHATVSALGGQLKRNLDIIRGAHYSVPARQLEALSNDPEIVFISADRAVFATGSVAPYTGNPDFGWRTAGADLAASVFGVDGTGIGIAVVDSGVNINEDLQDTQERSRIVYAASLIPGSTPIDFYGHGSHVSGILAGNGAQSSGKQSTYMVRGVAPNANLISLKALDDTGAGTDSAVIAAIQQAIALQNQYNIRVLNLSLGRIVTTSYVNDPLCQAVEAAWQAGIVVVVAAGNNGRDNSLGTNGYGTITAPGNSPYVITVGAMNTVGTLTSTDDNITSYSSKGPTSIDQIVKPDLVAPGNRIISLYQAASWLDVTYPGNAVAKSVYMNDNGKSAPAYFELSGTSMATPMVAGAAALMIQQNPALTPDQVKARLMQTATKFAPGYSTATDPVSGITYTSEYDIFTIGAGYLNIPAALSSSAVFQGAALSPAVTYDAASGQVFIQPGALLAVWGTGTVSPTLAVWGTGAVFGTVAVWGTSTPQAFSDIWGSLAVWGTGQASGEAVTIAVSGDN